MLSEFIFAMRSHNSKKKLFISYNKRYNEIDPRPFMKSFYLNGYLMNYNH